MKIAILGGGLTGLTAAYYLAKKGYSVTVYEKENELGGLAKGYKKSDWEWYLERTVHHLFSNDDDILSFAEEIGFNSIFFQKPETASLYKNSSSSQISNSEFIIYPLDSPIDLLRFPLLNFFERLRVGVILAFLKIAPPLKLFERTTAEEFLTKTMGKKAWKVLWQELFRKKFGKYAGNILASFIWARVKKRTKKLGYINGGFQNFVNYLEKELTGRGVKIYKNAEIKEIKKINTGFLINKDEYGAVISTLPTPVTANLTARILPVDYLKALGKIRYLHSLGLVIESEEPIFEKTYWMNILANEIPLMGLFQQTNFIDKKHYGEKNILYCGWYLQTEDNLWKMGDEEIAQFIRPQFKKINPDFEFSDKNISVFRAMYAQPIFEKEFLKSKPDFKTPLKNFFIANLDMTYPYDRGTNYAVALGKHVAGLL